MTGGVLINEKKWGFETKRCRGEGHVKKTGSGIGTVCPQIKECQEPPEAGRGKQAFSYKR